MQLTGAITKIKLRAMRTAAQKEKEGKMENILSRAFADQMVKKRLTAMDIEPM